MREDSSSICGGPSRTLTTQSWQAMSRMVQLAQSTSNSPLTGSLPARKRTCEEVMAPACTRGLTVQPNLGIAPEGFLWQWIARSGPLNDLDRVVLAAPPTPNDLDDVFAGGASILAWFKARSDGENSVGRVLSKEQSAGASGWSLYVSDEDATNGTLDISFTAKSNGGTDALWVLGTCNIDEWVCIELTWDSDSMSTKPVAVINGRPSTVTGTDGSSSYDSDASTPLHVGNRDGTLYTFDGWIGLCAIWSVTHTLNEMQKSYGATRGEYQPIGTTIVDRIEVTADTDDLILGGLQGENDGYYRLVGKCVRGGDSSSVIWSWEPDGTTTNQAGQYTQFSGGTGLAGSDITSLDFIRFINGDTTTPALGFTEMLICPMHTRGAIATERMYKADSTTNDGTTTAGAHERQIFNGIWDETTTEIAEIHIHTTGTDGIGEGTQLTLYRMTDTWDL